MPYETLPPRLRQLIPSSHGQRLFRSTFNSQMSSGKKESVAFATAWAALDRAGYKRDPKTGVYSRVEKSSTEGLKNKLEEWDEKYADTHGKITMGMLRDVYDRGVGAYRTNPSSVRPNVKSPEQWAMARVNSFLSAARGSKSINHDKDIHDKIKKSDPSPSDVHVPSAQMQKPNKPKKPDLDKAESFKPPASARNNARRVLRWKEKYGDEVKGMTQVGWARANQLASGENLSRETVARMSAFARHRKNAEIDPKYKSTPWKDRGYVAWLGWGGTSGVNWANSKMESLKKRQIDDDMFTMPDEAKMRSMALGLGGEVHVHERDGQAVYMPGESHEDYLEKIEELAGIINDSDDDDDPVKQGLLERAISAIIGSVMDHDLVNKSSVSAKVLKMDDEQKIVWGWAYVSTEDGQLLVDTQGDSIEPVEMEKMANDFMTNARNAKVMHEGEDVGVFIHSFPLTNELMKAFDILSDREGWIVGMLVEKDQIWKKYKSGEYTGFSIGGKAGDYEVYDAA
jgi:hypothetical protein